MVADDELDATALPLLGRCYCGKVSLSSKSMPQTVTYCHCKDCKRITGSPLPAFAAFASGDVTLKPEIPAVSHFSGVRRWFCRECGSPLLAHFDYLPDQVFVPIGIMEKPDHFAPEMHCFAGSQAPWLDISDTLPRETGTGQAALGAKSR